MFGIDTASAGSAYWRMHFSRRTGVIPSLVALAGICVSIAHAELRLPAIFSHNMVLQQGKPLPIWGWADAGSVVRIELAEQSILVLTDKTGQWSVTLNPLLAGGPHRLEVRDGTDRLVVTNVLVGEVWVCSGQSNMEWPLERSADPDADIASATNQAIRFFRVPRAQSDWPAEDVAAHWAECSPETARGFSAVGYYFGRDLLNDLRVPIGLIGTYWGGTPAEVWTPREALNQSFRYQADILLRYQKESDLYTAAMEQYQTEKAAAEAAGETFTKRPPRAPWKPSALYNAMIAPLQPFAFRGAIWYQGESNAGRAELYRSLFPDMIQSWRDTWWQGNFPFLCVQLAPYKAIQSEPGDSEWAELRDAQLLATRVLPNVGMVVITDVGDEKDIHPKQKAPVGMRLALAARGMVYGENIVYSGPVYREYAVAGDHIGVFFDHVGEKNNLVQRGDHLTGFAICGADRQWKWANAKILQDDMVAVWHEDVKAPVAVRFGWADYPVVNLWNKAGLPASPFRTDDFPLITGPLPQKGSSW